MEYTIEDLIKILEELGKRFDNCNNKLIKDELLYRKEELRYPKPSQETIDFQKRNGNVLTMVQLYHLASMVVNEKRPDAKYDANEWYTWELLNSLYTNPNSLR